MISIYLVLLNFIAIFTKYITNFRVFNNQNVIYS
jgi:hypothetical protein